MSFLNPVPDDQLDGLRPQMPSQADEDRSARQLTRLKILMEDWDQILYEWMSEKVDPTRLATWGAPDTAVNTLGNICRQLTTPGLYGKRPAVAHISPFTVPFAGAGGMVDRSGYWTLMQFVSYLTLGLGDMLLQPTATAEGFAYRTVFPHNVWVDSDPERSDRPVRIWELRTRFRPEISRWVYAWDQWDLGEPSVHLPGVRPPSFKIVQASGADTGLDLSNFFGFPANGAVGDTYRWRNQAGKPFVNFGRYRAEDTGLTWNYHTRRGATKGCLNAATNWTYASHCAKDASGKTVIAAGLQPIVEKVDNAGGNNVVRSIQLSPGAILYHQVVEGSQPFVQEIGPGADLPNVLAYARVYETLELRRWGIEADDATAKSSDPESGAAKFISRQSKREYAEQVKPLFERADQEMLRLLAAHAALHGLGTFDEEHYSIEYQSIEESPAEQKERREQLDWEDRNGLVDPAEKYMRLHPGVSRADAEAELVRIAVAKAEHDQRVREALGKLGLLSTPPANDPPVPPVPPVSGRKAA